MTYESNGTFVSEVWEHLEHLRRDPLPSRGESAVDIEETNSLLDGTIFQIGVLLGMFSHNKKSFRGTETQPLQILIWHEALFKPQSSSGFSKCRQAKNFTVIEKSGFTKGESAVNRVDRLAKVPAARSYRHSVGRKYPSIIPVSGQKIWTETPFTAKTATFDPSLNFSSS